MKKRLQPLFDADGTGKNREWTFEYVIERLKNIRRQKVSMAGVEFLKLTTPEPDLRRILDVLEVSL